MGTDYQLILKIEGNLITLKVWGDNSCGTLVKKIIKIKGPYNYDKLKYCVNLNIIRHVYDGIKKVKMIIDQLFPKLYDEKEIEIFESHVRNTMIELWCDD